MTRVPSRRGFTPGHAPLGPTSRVVLTSLLALSFWVAVGLFALAVTPAAARAASTGTITGTVTAASGGPLAGTLVDACRADSPAVWPVVSHVLSAGDGTYAFSGLPAGTYRISFSNAAGGYRTMYNGGVTDFMQATSIEVTADSTASGIDAVMAPIGSTTAITGKVTDAGGVPLARIAVIATDVWTGGWASNHYGYTASDGTYDICELSGGIPHVVHFTGDYGTPYAEQYWKAAESRESATQLVPPAGTTTSGIDATMALVGHISGTVTDEDDGAGLADVVVYAYRSNGKGEWPWSANVVTAADGTYDIGNLTSGTYRIEFHNYSSNVWQYYDDAPTLGSASDVSVTPGATTPGIDAEISSAPKAACITGWVTDQRGNGLADIDVTAYLYDESDGWDYAGDVGTASDGGYLLTGLPDGTYRLEFSDYGSGVFASRFYDNVATFEAATDIDLTAGDTRRIDATLAPAGHISGRVSVVGSADLSSIDVVAYQSDGSGGWDYVSDVLAESDGTYDLSGLAAGSYRVGFEDYSGAYLPQYYPAKTSLDSATDVLVTAGGTASGIDATLLEAGHITGLVTNPSLHGLGRVAVTAYQLVEGNWSPVSYAMTTSGGSYDLGGLATGAYRLQFTDYSGLYGSVWYANGQSPAAATDVAVIAGLTTPGINATLALAGHIAGTVTGPDHAGLADIYVTAYQADGLGGWAYVNDVMTAGDGSYDLGGLTGGTYRLEIADYDEGEYYTQYYNNKASLDVADDVAVTAGATTAGVSAMLASALIDDAIPPTTTITGGDALWHNAQVSLALSAADNAGGSGMTGGEATTRYRIGNGSWKAGTTVIVPAPADHTGDGLQTVSYVSCDAAGNWETPKSVTVRIDTTAPAGSFTLNGAAAATLTPAVAVASSVSDTNGVVSMRFSTDGKASWSGWASYNASAALTLPGGNGDQDGVGPVRRSGRQRLRELGHHPLGGAGPHADSHADSDPDAQTERPEARRRDAGQDRDRRRRGDSHQPRRNPGHAHGAAEQER